jgi:hypothetical protein
MCTVVAAAWLMWSGQVIWSFFAGGVRTANVILYKTSKFELTETKMFSKYFKEQSGDWLNIARPRGYIVADLKLTEGGKSVRITNCHTSKLFSC